MSLGNAETLTKVLDCPTECPQQAQFSNVRFCQFGRMMFYATVKTLAILAEFVVRIIFISTEKQMFWIDATRNIASVQDINAVRNWAAKQFPAEAVRSVLSQWIDGFEKTVTVTIYGTRPNPAARYGDAVYLFKKPLGDRLLGSHFRASLLGRLWSGAGGVCASSASHILG